MSTRHKSVGFRHPLRLFLYRFAWTALIVIFSQAMLQVAAAKSPSQSNKQRNQVIVSPRKGDYPDPIGAAKNAYEGDHWCISPKLPKHPCVIKILSGIYVLPETLHVPAGVALQGVETREVLLLAGRGVSVGVLSEGPLIADLSIGSDEPNGIALAFNNKLRRVHVSSAGGGLVDVYLAGVSYTTAVNFDLVDCEIQADGSAIYSEGASLQIRSSRLISKLSTIYVGYMGELSIKDSSITMTGDSPDGAIYADETQGDIEIIGGTISATYPEGWGSSIELHDMYAVDFIMIGTHVAGDIYLDGEFGVGNNILDGVTIKGSFNALSYLSSNTTIRRSLIDASDSNQPIAIRYGGDDATRPLEVFGSWIIGETRINDGVLSPGPATFFSTILSGPLVGDRAYLTCKNVLDANYVDYQNTCPPE